MNWYLVCCFIALSIGAIYAQDGTPQAIKLSATIDTECAPGYIDYVVHNPDGALAMKLDTMSNEIYTDRLHIIPTLLQAFIFNREITVYSPCCPNISPPACNGISGVKVHGME